MSAVAGWYPDPEGDTSRLRYWDGTQWTDNYTPIPTAAPAEDPQVAQAAAYTAWMIPMTVISWGIYKGTRANTVAFGVCTLIFVDLISGILLLISHKDTPQA